jgi:hypothetical protein
MKPSSLPPPQQALAGALQEDRDDLFSTIYIEIRESMGRRLYRLVETRSYRYKQYGPEGSGGSESLPQSKEENGLDGTRKYHPRLDSRLRRRIVSAATHFLRSGREGR